MGGPSEKARLNDILVGVSALPTSIFWRNNTGTAWQGQQVQRRAGSTIVVEPGMVILRNARPISFGLKGSGDVIGAYRSLPIAIEVKTEGGRQSQWQRNFQGAWEKAGGIYLLVRDRNEAVGKISTLG